MSLKIIYGKSGTGKSSFCFNEISNLIKKEKNIYVITPEQFSFTAEKKLMDITQDDAVVNAEVITFNRMAYRILSEVGGLKKEALSKTGKAMLIYSILNNNKSKLKFLGKSDDNVELVGNAITEFKKHGVNKEILQNEIDDIDDTYLKTKLEDINLVYQKFQEHIENKYIDETDLLTMLAEKIDKTDMFKDSCIYIDEFSGFTSQEYDIVQKLMKIAKQVNITISSNNLDFNTIPETDIYYTNKMTMSKLLEIAESENIEVEKINLNETKRFKTPELKHLEDNLYKNNYKKYENEIKNIQLFLAKDPYTEIEEVARNIVKLVKNEEYRYKDISVITKNIDTYSNLIKAIFSKYDIPVFIDEKKDLNQNIIVKYILSVLDIFSKNWSYKAMFNYIKSGFLDIDQDKIFELENYCIKYGIQKNKWHKDFIYGYDKEQDKEEIDNLNSLRKQIVEPLDKLKENIDKEKTVKNICMQIYNFLLEQNIEEKVKQKIFEFEDNNLLEYANEYALTLNIIINILDDMVIVFKDDKITIDKFIQIFKIGLKNSELGKIPEVQDQIIVGDVDRSRSHKVKATFIIGLNDGVFQNVKRDEGFLNDKDRQKLKQDGIELAKTTLEILYEDNFNIYKTFTTAEEKIYLSYTSSDLEGKSLRPSVLITKVKKIFPKIQEKSDVIYKEYEIINKKQTYEDLLENIYQLKTEQNIDDVWYEIYQYYKKDKEYNIKLQEDLRGLQYTNMPEDINEENINKLYGNNLKTSISKLEQYRKCPFSYYLKYGLNLKEKEELKIQSLNTGTFMHEVIDEFFTYTKDSKLDLNELTDEDIKNIIDKIVKEKLQLSKNYIFTSTAKYKTLVIRLKRILTKAMKYILQTLNESDFNVLGTELEFGEKGKYKPILLELDDGKKVEITGKIDRIDIAKGTDGNYLRIIDYKSSAKNIDLNEVYAGLQIQLLTYMDAVCKVEDLMPAGILYFSLLEQIIKADKKMTEEEIEEKIKSNFKMKGLILADVKVIKMHDKKLDTGASNLVPAYIDKSGNVSPKRTNGVTKEEFEDLQKYMNYTIKQIAKEIYSGKIDLKPYNKDGVKPCDYCHYKAICSFNPGFCNNKYNYIDKRTKDDVMKDIKEKVSK